MDKLIAVALIVGFAIVDFLFFHDLLKPGEHITFPQYLTGILSIAVFYVALRLLMSAKAAKR